MGNLITDNEQYIRFIVGYGLKINVEKILNFKSLNQLRSASSSFSVTRKTKIIDLMGFFTLFLRIFVTIGTQHPIYCIFPDNASIAMFP